MKLVLQYDATEVKCSPVVRVIERGDHEYAALRHCRAGHVGGHRLGAGRDVVTDEASYGAAAQIVRAVRRGGERNTVLMTLRHTGDDDGNRRRRGGVLGARVLGRGLEPAVAAECLQGDDCRRDVSARWRGGSVRLARLDRPSRGVGTGLAASYHHEQCRSEGYDSRSSHDCSLVEKFFNSPLAEDEDYL
ncbi:MAG TPA: hypothetical protein VLE99_03680 [Candidatus Saccharimonadales bacterium]|nr:hypothetical protein [Candidatus Saccharimonadales bacterium]